MRHFIFPEKDTFITNKGGYEYKNFGLDQILFLGTATKLVNGLVPTTTYNYINENVVGIKFQNYSGKISGSFVGTTPSASLNIVIFNKETKLTASYFSGTVTGANLVQYYPTQQINSSSFTGTLTDFSGSIHSFYISGSSTGSLTVDISCEPYALSGSVNNLSGSIVGLISGSETRNIQRTVTSYKKEVQRILMKFNLDNIFSSYTNGDIVSFPKFTLCLKTAREENLPLSYNIHVFPISQSWEMGDGETITGGSDSGTDWYYRDYKNGTFWHELWDDYQVPPTENYLLDYSLAQSQSFSKGGATWYSASCSQSLGYQTSDVNVDVSEIVKYWYSGSIPNEGFIILHSQEIDQSNTYGQIRYFSKDTNTIYYPYLEAAWDDSTFSTASFTYSETGSITSSLQPIDFNNSVTVVLKNIKKSYKFGDIPRINVFSRESYPVRNFERNIQHTSFLTPKYLPVETFYSIKDIETDQTILDFNEFTKLSCDDQGNYFLLDTTSFPQERYYKILIRTEKDGQIYTFDNGDVFKIVR